MTTKAYYIKNKDKISEYNRSHWHLYYPLNRIKRLESVKLWRRANPKKAWAKSTLDRHKQKGYKIVILRDELYNKIKTVDKCEICYTVLDWEIGNKNKKVMENSPTLDRINNEIEIRLDNVQILCAKCNRTKSNRTMEEFIQYCQSVIDKFVNREVLK